MSIKANLSKGRGAKSWACRKKILPMVARLPKHMLKVFIFGIKAPGKSRCLLVFVRVLFAGGIYRVLAKKKKV